MKFIKTTLHLVLLNISIAAYAQKNTDVLVTINDSLYTVGDFEHLYNKNIDIIADDAQKDIDTYLKLYKTYKLKLQNAYELGIDKSTLIQQEYKSYRTEIAEKYFINENELDRLLAEALQRKDFEVKASHILIAVDEFAQPADTLKAYNKAIEIRNKILSGLSFEDAALKYSDDLSAKANKGNLGYFGVFKMVYPFESAAYNTNVGAISLPVRTNFGYHILNVHNKRSTSKIKNIAHILVQANDINDKTAKDKINDIYNRLQAGDPFYDVAFHFSEDIHSRDKGGDLGLYSEGVLNIEGISDIVYELNFKDAYSKPFYSQYGWHIVAVTNIKDQLTDEQLSENFLRIIKTDSRSKILEKDLMAHLKDLYNFKSNDAAINETVKLLNRQELINQPHVEDNDDTQKILATFFNKQITAKNLLDHIYSHPRQYATVVNDELLIKKAFDFYSYKSLKDTYNSELENMFPEFKQNLKEYKEGLMLFSLLEDKIWNESTKDTVAIKNYYELNKLKYTQKPNFIGEVFVFDNKSEANTYRKLLKNKFDVKESDFNIRYKYQGQFYLTDKRLPKNLDITSIGKKTIKHENKYYVFDVRSKIEEKQLTYDEVKNLVLADYQHEYEMQYNKNLLDNAKIQINQAALDLLKNKYNKKSLN